MPKKKLYPFEDEERLLKLSEVCLWLGVAPSSVNNWIKAGHFPKPVVLGNPENAHAAVRFRKVEVDEWINGRPREKKSTDVFTAQAEGKSQKDFPEAGDDDET